MKKLFNFKAGGRTKKKDLLVGFLGIFSFIYILNPGWGGVELIPDFIPVVGNLDEASAVLVVLSALNYFGIDLLGFLGKLNKKNK